MKYRKKPIEVDDIKLEQKQAWENLYKKVVLDITDWANLAEKLDDIITDFIATYEAVE